MARQPIQVHIFLFRRRETEYEYAIFNRSDMPECWQGVCGGLEDSETIWEGARRELYEEAGVTGNLPLYKLESISYLPDNIFSDYVRSIWGSRIVVIPMYFFAMPYDGEIKLSHEHSTVEWMAFEDAYRRVLFKDQKIALYELHERLTRGIGF